MRHAWVGLQRHASRRAIEALGPVGQELRGLLGREAHNPFDDSRIHPECYFDQTEGISYDFAQKICSDALDRDFDRDDPEGYQDVVIAALDDSRTRMEKDLRKQQQHEFDDKVRDSAWRSLRRLLGRLSAAQRSPTFLVRFEPMGLTSDKPPSQTRAEQATSASYASARSSKTAAGAARASWAGSSD